MVVFVEAVVELTGKTAKDLDVAQIRPTQAADGHAAGMAVRGDENDALAHAGRLNGRGHASRGVDIDDHIGFVGFGGLFCLEGGAEYQGKGEEAQEVLHGGGRLV